MAESKSNPFAGMNPVVHFEMPYEDKERMAAFYSTAFGWKPQMLGPEMGDYVVVTTTEMDEKTKFPKDPGRINGGFYKKPDDPMGQRPSVTVAVESMRDAIMRVTAAGGTMLGEPMPIPGIGLYAGFLDTEGNRVSMIEPLPMNPE